MDRRPPLSVPGSRPAQVLLLAAIVLGGLAGMVARAPGGTTRAVTGAGLQPASAAAVNSEDAAPTTASEAHPADPQEGAVPSPDETLVSAAASSDPLALKFAMPLAAWAKVTDRYGAPRGGGLVHGGIDLALEGLNHSTVTAACGGDVGFTGYSGAYGNHVIIDCGGGYSTLYGHLSSIAVTMGTSVEIGAKVGISGSTGFSTGEHLHFEVRFRGTPVNPENYLDFHIAPGTPLSDGPIWFPGSATATPTPAPAATATSTPTATPTATPTFTPTPTPTNTPTATPTAKTAKKTPTPPPLQ